MYTLTDMISVTFAGGAATLLITVALYIHYSISAANKEFRIKTLEADAERIRSANPSLEITYRYCKIMQELEQLKK